MRSSTTSSPTRATPRACPDGVHSLRRGHAQHRLDGDALGRVVHGGVDVAEIVELDQGVEREPALPIKGNQLRNDFAGPTVALADAADAAARNHQTVDVEAGLRLQRWRADDSAGTANAEA